MAHKPKLWCGECNLEMTCMKTGVVLEAMTEQADGITPYYKVASDQYACSGCGHTAYYVDHSTEVVQTHDPVYEEWKADVQVFFHGMRSVVRTIFKGSTP